MYRKETNGLIKHGDFIILDLLVLQAALMISYGIFRGWGNLPYEDAMYRNISLLIELVSLLVIAYCRTFKNVLKRGVYRELVITVKHAGIVLSLTILFLYLIKAAEQYSRLILVGTFVIYILLTYPIRLLWKRVLKKSFAFTAGRNLLVLTHQSMAETVLNNIKIYGLGYYHIAGLVFVDEHAEVKEVNGVSVVADLKNAAGYICREWIDEVFVFSNMQDVSLRKAVEEIMETGVTVHINVPEYGDLEAREMIVEKLADYTVLTRSMKQVSSFELASKRVMDILGGLLGCIITAVIFVFLAPAIYLSSPGPFFFSQERVGRNGKIFKLYKFRSMYLDAEQRKAELMEQNKINDGRMFKMDFDPRVIGNKLLPDGTKKTGLGQFMRSSSLDEFPQFWNVLKGDMSLVGTRPPLPEEVSCYELNHRSRLSIKPGLTGMWQVSGRSTITDFDEVVRLDREYINNWNLGLDIKILMKTVLVVLGRSGSV